MMETWNAKAAKAAKEFTALINIRPAQGNRSMEVQDASVRERIRILTFALIGEGESL